MDIERAIHYISDYGSKIMNSDFTDAMNTLVREVRELRRENAMLRRDREVENE